MRPLDGICLRQSTNPATTGCPLAAKNCRQTHARASPRGEWRSHSNGRRVVAASVLVTKLRCPSGGNRMKKVPSPFPGKPLETRPRSGSLNLELFLRDYGDERDGGPAVRASREAAAAPKPRDARREPRNIIWKQTSILHPKSFLKFSACWAVSYSLSRV